MISMTQNMTTRTQPHIALAERLVQTLGYASAVRSCRYHQWLGVLEHLSQNKVRYLRGSDPQRYKN